MSRSTILSRAKLSVLDLLSHRTGVAWADALYLQSNNNILLPKQESIRTFDYLPVIKPPRSAYMYNNHAYNIAGLVIEKLSGKNWGDFVRERLFEPLGMTRTFTKAPDDPNTAIPYNILLDRTPFKIPFSAISSESMMFAGQSVRGSLADLLRLYKAFLESMQKLDSLVSDKDPSVLDSLVSDKDSSVLDSLESEKDSSDTCEGAPLQSQKLGTVRQAFQNDIKSNIGPPKAVECQNDKEATTQLSPLKELASLMRPHISRPVDSLLEQTYALGWNRTQLPGKLDFGWNAGAVKAMPTLGGRFLGRIVIWHGGKMPGTTAAVCLLPESGTGVVVLQNSLGLCDVADWACQLLLDKNFLGSPVYDYVRLASESVTNGGLRMKEVQARLEREQVHGTKHRPLHA